MSHIYDGDFIRLGSRLDRITKIGDQSQGRLPVREMVGHLSLGFRKRFQVLKDYVYSLDDLHWIVFFLGLANGGAGLGYASYKVGKWGERTMGAKSILKKFFKK